MKKFLFLIYIILTCVVISGCNLQQTEPNSDNDYLLLSKSTESVKLNNQSEINSYEKFSSLVQSFSTDLSEKTYNKYNSKYDQMVVSPLSIYMALAMATGVGDTEVQEELSNFFGISYNDIIEYTKHLYSKLVEERKEDDEIHYKLALSNSVWLNESFTYKQEGLELLSKSFYADSYQAPFTSNNKEANKAIRDYIYRNTNGLIDNEYNFDPATLFLLINTLYFKEKWNRYGDELYLTKLNYDFKNSDNSLTKTKLMIGHYILGRAIKADGFEYFYTTTATNARIYFIKPTTKSLSEVFTKENLDQILNNRNYNIYDYEKNEKHLTRCLFPQFEATFDEDIVPLLRDEYNLTKIFKEYNPNFNKLSDEESRVDQIIHQAKLKVNRLGVEGAAVTIVSNEMTAAPNPEQYIKVYNDFIIDRSFGFVITKYNQILFSGVVNNLQ